MLINTIIIINWLILCYLFLLCLMQIILSVISLQNDLLQFKEVKKGDVFHIMHSYSLPPVTALIAAYNEEKDILHTIQSLLKSSYPNLFILISNDGSTDNMVAMLVKELQMEKVSLPIPSLIATNSKIINYYISTSHPNISLIDKEHCDKSDTLNIGVNACQTPYFITIDADTVIDKDAISDIVFSAITKDHAISIGGAVYISNGCTIKNGEVVKQVMSHDFVVAFQICEYLRSFLFNRTGWNLFGGSICYSGAFTLFDRQAVIDIGGFEVHNFANDFEIVTHLQSYRLYNKLPYQLECTPTAACWTDVPVTIKSFWHQRTLWQVGSLKSISKHIYMLFNPRYKMVGMFTMPFFLFFELLSPFVELAAHVLMFICWYFNILDLYTAIMFIIACYGFILISTISAFLLNILTFKQYGGLKDIPWIVFISIAEFLGFRQMHVICRVLATGKFLFEKLFQRA